MHYWVNEPNEWKALESGQLGTPPQWTVVASIISWSKAMHSINQIYSNNDKKNTASTGLFKYRTVDN